MNQFGGGEAAALTLWQRRGVKVLPGAYLTHASGHGTDPGESYIRVALVDSEAATVEALERIVSVAV